MVLKHKPEKLYLIVIFAYTCSHIVILKLKKNASKNSSVYNFNDTQKHEEYLGSETSDPEQRLTSPKRHKITFTSMHITFDGINFCEGLECIYDKHKSRAPTHACDCLNDTCFLPIKTWLFIAFNTALMQ